MGYTYGRPRWDSKNSTILKRTNLCIALESRQGRTYCPNKDIGNTLSKDMGNTIQGHR